MEGLIELVANSLARHGIECPAPDSPLAWGRKPVPVQFAVSDPASPAEPTLTSALPEHNYRKMLQTDPSP
jgi:hypothetical protein